MLLIVAVMLYTKDNYFGIPTLMLWLITGKSVTWDSAYRPLHKKLGLESSVDNSPRSRDSISPVTSFDSDKAVSTKEVSPSPGNMRGLRRTASPRSDIEVTNKEYMTLSLRPGARPATKLYL